MPTKIFVGNLSANTRSEDIRVLFEKYGKVTECDVLKNFGFVHMQDETEANAAILELDGYSVKGTRMRVEKSTGKSKGGGDRRGSRGRGGGSRGGSGGGGRGGDRYSSSRYDPYARPPSYDYYDRGRYPPPPRDDRRYPPPGEDRYARDRYDYRYERRPPPADDYAYERRPPPPDSYYRDRVDRSGLSRPPPDYYARRDPYYPDYPDYPDYHDARGDYAPLPPPPPKSPYEDPGYSNGYGGDASSSQGQNYYDRFYKTPPAAKPLPSDIKGAEREHAPPGQGFIQSQPIYF